MNSLKRLTIDIPYHLHRQLKVESFKSENPIRLIIIDLLKSHFRDHRKSSKSSLPISAE